MKAKKNFIVVFLLLNFIVISGFITKPSAAEEDSEAPAVVYEPGMPTENSIDNNQALYGKSDTNVATVGSDGTLNYNYPMGQTSLNYSSDVGWRLSYSTITRSTKYGIPRYSLDDTFLLDGAELVFIKMWGEGERIYQLKYDNKCIAYYYSPETPYSYWVVDRPDGSRTRYGEYFFHDNSTFSVKSGKFKDCIREWAISKVTSKNDYETIQYQYFVYESSDTWNYCLKNIITQRKNSGRFLTNLVYTVRHPYPTFSYRYGTKVENRYLPIAVYNYLEAAYPNEKSFQISDNELSPYNGGWFNLLNGYLIEYDIPAAHYDYQVTSITPVGTYGPLDSIQPKLTPTKFYYQPDELSFSKDSIPLGIPTFYFKSYDMNLIDQSTQPVRLDLMDMNGDGLLDVVSKGSAPHTINVRMNKGDGTVFGDEQTWNISSADNHLSITALERQPDRSFQRSGVIDFVDMDGDGLPDRIEKQKTDTNISVNLNKKDDFAPATPWKLDDPTQDFRWSYSIPRKTYYLTAQDLFDINGDGFPDIIDSRQSLSDKKIIVRYNDGQGSFGPQVTINGPHLAWVDIDDPNFKLYPFPRLEDSNQLVCTRADMIDMNGDGLIDAVAKKYENLYIWFNNGYGFNSGVVWTTNDIMPLRWVSSWDDGYLQGIIYDFIDINGDGLPDRVTKDYSDNDNTQLTVSYNTGHGFTQDYKINTNDRGSLSLSNTLGSPGFIICGQGIGYLDMNGDGRPDRVMREPYAGKPLLCNYSLYGYANKLVKIIDNNGGITKIAYQAINKAENPECKPSKWVVSSITDDNNMWVSPSVYTTSYAYKDGVYDCKKKEFRGFGEVRKTCPTGDYTITKYYTDEIKVGKIYEENLYSSDNKKFYDKFYTYDVFYPIFGFNQIWQMLPKMAVTYTYDGDSANKKIRKMEYDYTFETSFDYQILSMLTTTSYGEVRETSLSEPKALVDAGNDTMIIQTKYLNNTYYWIFGLEDTINVLNPADNTDIIRGIKNYYSNDGARNLIRTRVWDGTQYVNPTTYIYDDYGNVIKTFDSLGKATTTTYDNYFHRYPIATINAYGHKMENAYDYLKRVICVTDVNNLYHRKEYDAFGHVIHEWIPNIPNGSEQFTEYREVVHGLYDKISIPKNIIVRKMNTNAVPFEEAVYFDGLGRKIQIKKSSEHNWAAAYAANDIVYGIAKGEYEIDYVEYPSLTLDYTTYEKPNNQPWTSVYYYLDSNYGKVKVVTRTDGKSLATCEKLWVTTVIDANKKETKSYKDGLGRIVKVTDANNVSVTYTYLPGTTNLQSIEDPNSQGLQISYDGLGRKKTLIDPDLGTINYSYDANNNLVSTVDALGQKIKYYYDDLGRMYKVIYPGENNYDLYMYDIGTYKGCLWKILAYRNGVETFKRTFTYDSEGRVIKNECTIDGIVGPAVNYAYDQLGLLRQKYLSGSVSSNEVLEYMYDYGSRPKRLRNIKNSEYYVKDLEYNDYGQLCSMLYANDLETKYTYDSGFNLELLEVKNNSTALMSYRYKYDAMGNIKSKTDNIQAAGSEDFSYDDLYRLVAAKGAYGIKSYRYSDTGDILSKDGHVYQYANNSHLHGVSDDGEYQYQYDPNGNMVERISLSSGEIDKYTYDWSNRLIAVSKETGIINIVKKWVVGISFAVGEKCLYNGDIYTCLQAHTVYAQNWTPPNTPALWQYLGKDTRTTKKIFEAAYDPTGSRIKTVVNGITTYYFHPEVEKTYDKTNPIGETTYYFINGKRVAMRIGYDVNQTTPYYYHLDHLNSMTFQTDVGKNIVSRLTYEPYGGLSSTSGNVKGEYQYNDKPYDKSTELYYYGTRYYNPDLGRFITPDNFVPGGGKDLQGLNRYAYCLNNPIKYMDPSGNDPIIFQTIVSDATETSKMLPGDSEGEGFLSIPDAYLIEDNRTLAQRKKDAEANVKIKMDIAKQQAIEASDKVLMNIVDKGSDLAMVVTGSELGYFATKKLISIAARRTLLKLGSEEVDYAYVYTINLDRYSTATRSGKVSGIVIEESTLSPEAMGEFLKQNEMKVFIPEHDEMTHEVFVLNRQGEMILKTNIEQYRAAIKSGGLQNSQVYDKEGPTSACFSEYSHNLFMQFQKGLPTEKIKQFQQLHESKGGIAGRSIFYIW